MPIDLSSPNIPLQEHVALENEHERTRVQVCEAEAVRRHYVSMASALRGEAAMHTTSLDQLNTTLAAERAALKKLRVRVCSLPHFVIVFPLAINIRIEYYVQTIGLALLAVIERQNRIHWDIMHSILFVKNAKFP